MWRGKDCENVDGTDPLRQGDILRKFVKGHADSLWVVVTADCDIAQSRVTDSGLACVQLRSLKEYLLHDHLDRQLSRQLEARLREFREWLRAQWAKAPPPRTRLGDEAILEWIQVATAEEIVAALEIQDDRVIRYVEALLIALRTGIGCRAGGVDARSKFRALGELQQKTPKDWRQFVHSQLSRLQSHQLPEDVFFVTTIPEESSLGYITTLRSISFVPAASVAATIPDARDRPVAYARIARLSATFKHGLAQQLGFLFARIGYPAAYEAERDEIFNLVTNDLCDEFGVDDD
jgi:hypothetical protein